MHSEPPVGEQGYPRTYRMDARARRVVNGFLLVFAGLFLFLTVLDLARVRPRGSSLGDLLFVNLVMGALVMWLGSGYNKRVILHRDSIEVAGWFHSRKLNFAEIRGRQTTGSSRRAFPYAYILLPSDKSKRRLVLPAHLQTDKVFRDWIETIPKVAR